MRLEDLSLAVRELYRDRFLKAERLDLGLLDRFVQFRGLPIRITGRLV